MPSITRKTQADRGQRRAEISARLLEATETLLADGASFTELSVERLCAQAEISRSTFYAYFEDKGHLLRELTREMLGELGDVAREWWGSEQPLPREKLGGIILRLISTYRAHGILLGAVADTAVYDEAVREVFGGLIANFIGEIEAMIEQGREDATIASGAPARETAAMLVWMTVHSFYQEARGADPAALERLAQANSEIIWKTLYSG